MTLSFVTSGNGFDRSWRLRISQIPCSSIFRAEEGCMQYYTGVSGQIKSFNYDPNVGLQLSNQDYSICIRMERNFCGIQYMTCDDGCKSCILLDITLWIFKIGTNNTYYVKIFFYVLVSASQTNPVQPSLQALRSNSFTISGNTLNGQFTAMSDRNCQNDWLMIPCAMNPSRQQNSQITCADRLCGGAFNTDNSVNSTSIISKFFFVLYLKILACKIFIIRLACYSLYTFI